MTKPKPELLELENVDSAIKEACAFVRDDASRRLSGNVTAAALELPFGSPIEFIFYVWWNAISATDGDMLGLNPQADVKVGDGTKYVLDFSVSPADVDEWIEAIDLGVNFQQIGIELDGHDFHEKTKQQVTYRNKRDRDLQQAGWHIFHFSGSELWKSPFDAVNEVWNHSTSAYWDMKRRVRRIKASQKEQQRRSEA